MDDLAIGPHFSGVMFFVFARPEPPPVCLPLNVERPPQRFFSLGGGRAFPNPTAAVLLSFLSRSMAVGFFVTRDRGVCEFRALPRYRFYLTSLFFLVWSIAHPSRVHAIFPFLPPPFRSGHLRCRWWISVNFSPNCTPDWPPFSSKIHER